MIYEDSINNRSTHVNKIDYEAKNFSICSESWPFKLIIVVMIGAFQNDGGTGNNRTVQT